MNSVIIMSDEHSYQMMSYVSKRFVETPYLDRLANQSLRFLNAYTNCPVCAPARASFFTGYYVNRLGTWDNATAYDGTVPGLSHYLAEAGIPFAAFGKTHFHHQGQFNFSYEERVGYMKTADIGCYYRDDFIHRIHAENRYQNVCIRSEDTKDNKVIESAIRYMKNHLEEEWCVYIGLLDPHFPFHVKREYWDYYNDKIKELPVEMVAPYTSLTNSLKQLQYYFACEEVDEETKRKLLVGYCAAIAELDENIGRILEFLESSKLIEKTAIIYTSDHGEQMGAHGLWWKCTMFEESAHIPLLCHIPSKEGKDISDPVSLVDILPSVLEIHGVNTSDMKIDGESFLPFSTSNEFEMYKDYAFSEYHCHGIKHAMYMIRHKEYKYVLYFDDTEQLFNLEEDPKENNNLLAKDSLRHPEQEILDACRSRLYRVCDPEEVDLRAKCFQSNAKKSLGLKEYTEEKINTVMHPQNILGFPNMDNPEKK